MLEITLIQDLARKNLQEVPRSVLNMTNLKMLYLEGNYLVELPSELFILLEQLQWLDVRNNKLKHFPKTVMDHMCLETILLQNNQIEVVPLELGFIPNLKVLQLSGNPIEYPKRSILESGVQNLTKYLRNEYIKREERNKKELQGISDIEKLIQEEEDKVREELTAERDKPIITLKSFEPTSKILRKAKLAKKKMRAKNVTISSAPPKDNSNRYLHNLPVTRNEDRVSQQNLKDAFLTKMRDMLYLQEEELQKTRSKESMKRWRTASKFRRRPDRSYRPEVPYDYDLDFDKVPSRRDLQDMLLRKNSETMRTHKSAKKINVEKLINDIVDSLKEMERERNVEKTPRAQMDFAGREIKRSVVSEVLLSGISVSVPMFNPKIYCNGNSNSSIWSSFPPMDISEKSRQMMKLFILFVTITVLYYIDSALDFDID